MVQPRKKLLVGVTHNFTYHKHKHGTALLGINDLMRYHSTSNNLPLVYKTGETLEYLARLVRTSQIRENINRDSC
jgi:hypothetical protein